MNKNTIIKLIAVLAMCFLIGGALVACKGATGPAGPQGPQGEKGETGAAGSTPKLTIGANGNWFADGVDLGVKAPSADAACAEHDFEYVDVVKHTQTEDGIVVKACKTCGFAAVTTETLHKMVNDEIPANCLEAKWVGEICSVCGEKGKGEFVGKPNGHNFTTAQAVYEVNKPICQFGGLLVQNCTNCPEVKYEPVTAEEFDCVVIEWSDVLEIPTEMQFGLVQGACRYCDDVKDYDLPLIDSGKYEVETVKATTCATAGEYKYTYVDEAANLKAEFTLKPDATGHKLNGQNYAKYDTDKNDDVITVPYWYGTPDEAGRLPALNVKPFAGESFTCGDTNKAGYFTCEECDLIVYVYVNYGHNGAATIKEEASCVSKGVKNVVCDACGFKGDADIDPLAHVYIYVEEDATPSDLTDNLINLVGTCAGNALKKGETCTAKHTLNTIDGTVKPIVEYKKSTVKDANCLEYGEIKYEYKVEGIQKTYTANVDTPKTAHILNGEQVDLSKLTTTTKGVKAFADTPFANYACETKDIPAYFICEYCVNVEGVSAVNAVKVTKGHTETNVIYDEKNPATCEGTGKYTFDCTDPACATVGADGEVGKKLPGTSPALGHDTYYDFEEKTTGTTTVWDIYEKCNRCAAHNEFIATSAIEPEVVVEKKPTCYAKGYTEYRVLVNGEYTKIRKEHDLTGHTLNGLVEGTEEFNEAFVKNGGILTTVNGVNLFANTTIACTGSAQGYYVCEACKAAGLDATVQVTLYKDHDYSDVKAPATCLGTGTAHCADCDTDVSIPANGHKYAYDVEVDKSYNVTVTGVCGNCDENITGHEVEYNYTIAVDETSLALYCGKGTLVSAADCFNGAVTKYTISLALDANGDLVAIELGDKDTKVFQTVTFNHVGVKNPHKWDATSQIIVIERDEVVDEKTGETEKFYYVAVVCKACGEYTSNKLTATEYELFCEMVEDAKEALKNV